MNTEEERGGNLPLFFYIRVGGATCGVPRLTVRVSGRPHGVAPTKKGRKVATPTFILVCNYILFTPEKYAFAYCFFIFRVYN